MHPKPRWYICYNAKCRWAHTPRKVEASLLDHTTRMWVWPHPVCECSPEMEMRRWYGPPQAELVVSGDSLVFDTDASVIQQREGGR